MASNNFLFNLNLKTTSSSTSTPITLPAEKCSNGTPIDEYAGTGVYAWKVLYSIWDNYQSSTAAQFSLQQAITQAPDNNPPTPPCVGPTNIFVIRHGEKNTGSGCLNNNGIYRACEIVNFVNQLAQDGYPISYIISCNPCPYNTSNPSMREPQTVYPAAFMLNIPMFIYGSSSDFIDVCNQLFNISDTNNGQFSGTNVLICWEHAAIQQLCLNMLDTAGTLSPSRLPSGITTGDAFFKSKNPCPDGNYVYNNSVPGSTTVYSPPASGTIPGVGANTQFYPYWNNYNFDRVFWFSSSASTNYVFDFKTFTEDCPTCFPSNQIAIGLYQPLQTECNSSYQYYNKTPANLNVENLNQPPSSWSI